MNVCYVDEEILINDYEYEIVSEAKEMALPVETDAPDEKLETYADKELYVVIGYDDVCDNGNYEAILYGVLQYGATCKRSYGGTS